LGAADYLRRQLELGLQESVREQQPLSLVMIDLDGFDAINQRYGHAEGDRVLQAVPQLLLLNLRQQDLLCRLAGDRFVAVLPNTGETVAAQIARELAEAVRHLAHRSRQHGERIQLRASVAQVMALQESAESLLQRLNLALAKAKQPLALSA
ncbi:MAG TPA: GGDEF domain-containing protein, partial [Pseudomonas sp.]|nr:GGDEF domain-containing protein [Pseudomonas sp.]